MISIKKSLEHMAWSNQEIFKAINELPEDIYRLRAAEGEWPVGRLLTHLLGSGEWFRYCLTSEKWTDLTSIRSHKILIEQAPYLAQLDQLLIEQSDLSDEELTVEGEEGPIKTTRSMILSQAPMHAAEHKGQIATILKIHGFNLDLDKYDLWSFESRAK